MVQLIAHRGSSRKFPENTAAAFRNAVDFGADLLEVDIRRSADGVLYCFHDSQLRRLTGSGGMIERASARELDQLKVNQSEPLLRFSAFLTEFGKRAGIVLDIKSVGIEELVLDELDRYPPEREVVFSAFSPATLRRLRELRAELPTAFIVGPWRNLGFRLNPIARLSERLQQLGCRAVHIHKRLATPRNVRRLTEAGFSTSVWTVDHPELAAELAGLGVAGLITNVPELLVQQKS